jgi:spore germination protein KC
MKKLICLCILILFCTTGCYDYSELNKLAIVSGISIDYIDNEYKVAFEILNTKNREENENVEEVYVAVGSGSSISDAFYDTSLSVSKTVYVAHLKTVIISEEVARFHTEEIIDFLIRDNYIRNIFYLVLASDNDAYNILTSTSEANEVMGESIKELIDDTYYVNNISSRLNFEEFVSNIIDEHKDTYISSVKIEDGILKLGNIAVFNNYEMQGYLNEEESSTFNIINNTSEESHFKITCPNDNDNFIVFASYDNPKSSIKVKNNTITIKSKIEVRIIENHCDMDFKKSDTYEELEILLEDNLSLRMQELINTLINYNSDALSINHVYYAKYKKGIDFKKLNYKYQTEVYINRNGLVFEVDS